eukprot:UN22230
MWRSDGGGEISGKSPSQIGHGRWESIVPGTGQWEIGDCICAPYRGFRGLSGDRLQTVLYRYPILGNTPLLPVIIMLVVVLVFGFVYRLCLREVEKKIQEPFVYWKKNFHVR